MAISEINKKVAAEFIGLLNESSSRVRKVMVRKDGIIDIHVYVKSGDLKRFFIDKGIIQSQHTATVDDCDATGIPNCWDPYTMCIPQCGCGCLIDLELKDPPENSGLFPHTQHCNPDRR